MHLLLYVHARATSTPFFCVCVCPDKQGTGGDDEGAIVLHEDKNYYPDAQEVYPGVNTVLLDEDAQDLTEPLLKPVKAKTFSVLAHDVPELVINGRCFDACTCRLPLPVDILAIHRRSWYSPPRNFMCFAHIDYPCLSDARFEATRFFTSLHHSHLRACPPTGGEPGVHVEHGGDARVDPPRRGGGQLPLREDHADGPAGGADPSRGVGPQQ